MSAEGRTRGKRDPILVMYNALMAIGCLDSDMGFMYCFSRTKEIANAALKEMNVDHTKAVQKAVFGKRVTR